MGNYIVKSDFRQNWNSQHDLHDESQWVVTGSEIRELSRSWGVSVDELMKQVEEMKKGRWEVRKASWEFTRREYRNAGGYREFLAVENDTEIRTLAAFGTIEEARTYLTGKTSSIVPYPSNSLVLVEEFFIEEIDENGDPIGGWDVAPLDEYSKKFVDDIYYKNDNDNENEEG